MSTELHVDSEWELVLAPEDPQLYLLLERDYPNAEIMVKQPDLMLPLAERFEKIIGVENTFKYTMHAGSETAKTYQLKCRSGTRLGFYHDVQFGSKGRLTSWHGEWSYCRQMDSITAFFKYNFPERHDLKWTTCNRVNATTWQGLDQEQRVIEMKLLSQRTCWWPAYVWKTQNYY